MGEGDTLGATGLLRAGFFLDIVEARCGRFDIGGLLRYWGGSHLGKILLNESILDGKTDEVEQTLFFGLGGHVVGDLVPVVIVEFYSFQ